MPTSLLLFPSLLFVLYCNFATAVIAATRESSASLSTFTTSTAAFSALPFHNAQQTGSRHRFGGKIGTDSMKMSLQKQQQQRERSILNISPTRVVNDKTKNKGKTLFHHCRQDSSVRKQHSLFASIESSTNEEYGSYSEEEKINGKKREEATSSKEEGVSEMSSAFDLAVLGRYACTRFRRYKEEKGVVSSSSSPTNTTKNEVKPTAALSDPSVVQKSVECIELARRAPSGFNSQPYRILLVSNPKTKEQMAKYCLGRNADRVRDCDCTAIFLADRECGRDWKRFGNFLEKTSSSGKRGSKSMSNRLKLKIQSLVLLFSSGLPLPRFLAVPISFLARLIVVTISVLTNRKLVVPTLSGAETWSTKNTMLVAMSYMLGCTSRGLSTCPMEGYNAGGIRKVLGIPRRFSIPLVVSTGLPYHKEAGLLEKKYKNGVSKEGTEEEEEVGKAVAAEGDDMGMSHGAPLTLGGTATERYPRDEVVFGDKFGSPIRQDFLPA